MRKLLYIFLLSNIANAKTVNIVIIHKHAGFKWSEQAYYVVNADKKVWELRNFLFNQYGLSFKDYALAQQGKKGGFDELKEDDPLNKYGKSADASVGFFLVPKGDLSSK